MRGPFREPRIPAEQLSGGKSYRVAPTRWPSREIYAIHTDLIFTNSRMPYSESSRP
jgi:hypothetical protein